MAKDTNKKSGFNAGAYAVISAVAIAVILVILTIFAFTTRYTAFSPEKVAVAYTDGIVQTGDGYNAYKQTLVSKNQKFGNFVIDAYMAPYVNDEAEKNEIIGSGTEEEAKLLDSVYEQMYDYYVELLNTYGLDNYDRIFGDYFQKLSEVRRTVIGDEYMDTEFMFGVFESNVNKYGESLTGTEQELAQDGKTVLKEATVGKYQEMYGDDYKLVTTVKACMPVEDIDGYVAQYQDRIKAVVSVGLNKASTAPEDKKESMESAFNKLDCSDSINDLAQVQLEITTQDGTVVATQEVFVVKIGNSWYVDNTNVDTSALYLAK